ncbi:location of vulva defective 1-like [Haliotis rufescens]|uniref:location of vulva defective 1-like n=1 Tax=Haliotis rufescens TaxID=6454 RepID=UPI00201F95AF|nr:location of vulva defective 1-like [Haliotis rufescens]
MCTVTNGSTSVLSSSIGTTNAAATAPAAAESTTESDVKTSESDVTTSESDVTTVETESASTSEKITSASSPTTPKATANTSAASASIATPKSDVTTSESDVTTVKSESAQTPDATTSSNGKTTPVMQLPENLCPNCTTTNTTCVWLSSAGPSVDEMKELIKKLTLEKKTLSSYKREKTSASDDRPTAQAIGKVGIVFFVLAFAGVVLLDCGRVVDCLRKRNRKRVIFSKA